MSQPVAAPRLIKHRLFVEIDMIAFSNIGSSISSGMISTVSSRRDK